jgi:hypothetical protein
MTVLGSRKFIATANFAFAALLVLVASSLGFAKAQVDCGTIPAGRSKTDCYIDLSRINQQKSEIAASTARKQTGSAKYHQLTGSRPKTKRHP